MSSLVLVALRRLPARSDPFTIGEPAWVALKSAKPWAEYGEQGVKGSISKLSSLTSGPLWAFNVEAWQAADMAKLLFPHITMLFCRRMKDARGINRMRMKIMRQTRIAKLE
jgi:hypothetical protein